MFRIPNRIEKFEFDFSLRPTGRKHDISVGLKCTPPPPLLLIRNYAFFKYIVYWVWLYKCEVRTGLKYLSINIKQYTCWLWNKGGGPGRQPYLYALRATIIVMFNLIRTTNILLYDWSMDIFNWYCIDCMTRFSRRQKMLTVMKMLFWMETKGKNSNKHYHLSLYFLDRFR